MMLDVTVLRDGKPVYNNIALNDGVISKGSVARVVRLDVATEEGRLTKITGDGAIVSSSSTPLFSRIFWILSSYALRPRHTLTGLPTLI